MGYPLESLHRDHPAMLRLALAVAVLCLSATAQAKAVPNLKALVSDTSRCERVRKLAFKDQHWQVKTVLLKCHVKTGNVNQVVMRKYTSGKMSLDERAK
jgi:hypothetical protein